ncbi:MAG: helix-turn-helix transcriptional regulator [Bacteroidales bacterium]|nr:helix-turn-helix transcriptional regulator [Bacteroidales bacterium]
MKTINQIVGENLKKLRSLSGFTQEQIAASIGIERSAYSNYEGGIRETPFDVLEKLANLFGCEPFILFEDNIQVNDEILAAAFRISDLEENDLKEIAGFKDIVKSYLKMERISQNGPQ